MFFPLFPDESPPAAADSTGLDELLLAAAVVLIGSKYACAIASFAVNLSI